MHGHVTVEEKGTERCRHRTRAVERIFSRSGIDTYAYSFTYFPRLAIVDRTWKKTACVARYHGREEQDKTINMIIYRSKNVFAFVYIHHSSSYRRTIHARYMSIYPVAPPSLLSYKETHMTPTINRLATWPHGVRDALMFRIAGRRAPHALLTDRFDCQRKSSRQGNIYALLTGNTFLPAALEAA